MVKQYRLLRFALWLSVMFTCNAFTAQPVNLLRHSGSALTNLSDPIQIHEVSRFTTLNKTVHISFRETYLHYPIINGGGVVHLPNADQQIALNDAIKNKNSFLTGKLFLSLSDELKTVPALVLTPAQQNKALNTAVKSIVGNKQISEQQQHLAIFVDQQQKAHWVYVVSFKTAATEGIAQVCKAIVDAQTFTIYNKFQYNVLATKLSATQLKKLTDTANLERVKAGGVGGNFKIGMLYYDGLPGANHRPAFTVLRDPIAKICYMQDGSVMERDFKNKLAVNQFACEAPDPAHNNVYWNSDINMKSGAYNQANDIYVAGQALRDMFASWFGHAVWERKPPQMLVLDVNSPSVYIDWSNNDSWAVGFAKKGSDFLYPRTSLNAVAQWVSVIHKLQTSDGWYAWGYGESPALCFAYGDAFSQAAEYAATGTNSWMIDGDDTKEANLAYRYMDHPSRDCRGRKAGDSCSIETMNDVDDMSSVDGFYAAGVMNRAFYVLANSTADGWDVKKAFQTMLYADKAYWGMPTDDDFAQVSFAQAACGMLYAANDLGFDNKAVIDAYNSVGLPVDKIC